MCLFLLKLDLLLGLLAKHADMKAAAEVVEAQKQALLETADAFRGVHLDPNAHHWDDVRGPPDWNYMCAF